MTNRLLASSALVPVSLLATALPAHAADSTWVATTPTQGVSAQRVVGSTAPGASPLRQVRSSTVSCAGTLISRTPAKLGKTVVGELSIYIVNKNTGTAIACFKHVGPTKGVRLPTSVSIVAAKKATATRPAVTVLATGNFRSWAGPAAIGGVNRKGYCVAAGGAMKYKGKTITAQSPLMCNS